MRNFTAKEKRNGEMIVRYLSREAFELYRMTDPLTIYEYVEEGDKRYAIRGALGDIDDLTFSELEWYLKSMYYELMG